MLPSCQALSGCRAVGLSGCRALSGTVGAVGAVGAVGVLLGAEKVAEDIMHCQSNGYMVKILVLTMLHGSNNKTQQQCNG